MRPCTDSRAAGGFTLVEMIVSIVVAGVLLALVGMFGRWQIQSYFDLASRAALTDAADTAVRRISRELQTALPNSVRASGNYLEYIPIRDAGRYRAESDGSGSVFPLEFGSTASASKFDVLGPTVAIASGDQVVVYNLGLPGSDAYAGAPNNRRTPSTTGGALSQVESATAFAFPYASPANRFQVVGNPVSFECDPGAGVIRRYGGYGFLPSQPVAAATMAAGSSTLLVAQVAACSFAYEPGASQRNGIVTVRLTLSANDETVQVLNQVEILNTP